MRAVLAVPPLSSIPLLHNVKLPSTRNVGKNTRHLSLPSRLRSTHFSCLVRSRLGMKGGGGANMKDYHEQAMVLKKSDHNGGPRWFMPLECGGSSLKDYPLLLYLPGLDGVGLGLVKHHLELGKIFEVCCLHIPVMDRTPFSELVNLVEEKVRLEHKLSPKRPIYLVGEGVGGCLALSVAANNPHIDLLLLLANPATYFDKFKIHLLKPFLTWIRYQNSVNGENIGVLKNIMEKITHLQPKLHQHMMSALNYHFVTGDYLSIDTITWKLEMLIDSSNYSNSVLHKVRAQTLLLYSGKDVVLSSIEDGERLRHVLPSCNVRRFINNGPLLFMDDDFDLLYAIKMTGFYRRGRSYDWVRDFSIVTHEEIRRTAANYRILEQISQPAMFSTLKNGAIVSGLAGFPCEGPAILVGYHMLSGLESIPLVTTIFKQKGILLRGLAHPNMFDKSKVGNFFDLSPFFDPYRIMGCVPVSGLNMLMMLRANQHVLLYPGGMREAFHRKREEYKLFWPDETEFVRMAAKTGAKIVPFGVAGEDDIYRLCADYNDLMKIPFVKQAIEVETNTAVKLRGDVNGEVSKQPIHVPVMLPKVPGRFYFLFGKPIETKGRQEELKDRQKAQELYLHIKSEVEASIAYLKEKRKDDPYRNMFSRLLYQSTHGFNTEIPSFDP